jgi:hypothetical protein
VVGNSFLQKLGLAFFFFQANQDILNGAGAYEKL